jgi:hypothetical protein
MVNEAQTEGAYPSLLERIDHLRTERRGEVTIGSVGVRKLVRWHVDVPNMMSSTGNVEAKLFPAALRHGGRCTRVSGDAVAMA